MLRIQYLTLNIKGISVAQFPNLYIHVLVLLTAHVCIYNIYMSNTYAITLVSSYSYTHILSLGEMGLGPVIFCKKSCYFLIFLPGRDGTGPSDVYQSNIILYLVPWLLSLWPDPKTLKMHEGMPWLHKVSARHNCTTRWRSHEYRASAKTSYPRVLKYGPRNQDTPRYHACELARACGALSFSLSISTLYTQ